jgi:hypothetical protein
MERSDARPCVQDWGSIRIVPEDKDFLPETFDKGLASAFSLERYIWVPSAEVSRELPKGFTLALRCSTDLENNVRRFYPIGKFSTFIKEAFVAGLALLIKIKGLGSEEQTSYRIMWQFFERVRRTREHLGNRLLNAGSLHVSRSGRGASQHMSILPETVGMNAKGEGDPWSVTRLLQEGRLQAIADGISSPKEADCVHYGMLRAAHFNPLYIPQDKVETLIRQSLYTPISAETNTNRKGSGLTNVYVPGLVIERALEALDGHWDDESPEFDKWFSGSNNSFAQQIFKKKTSLGGRLSRDLVRRELQDLG